MPNDPVPGLLSRATEALDAEFGSLPAFEPAFESAADSAAMEQILAAVAELFADAAKEPFVFEVKTAPLSEVEKVWGEKESGVRAVFRT